MGGVRPGRLIAVMVVVAGVVVGVATMTSSSRYETASYAREHPGEFVYVVGELDRTVPIRFDPANPNYTEFTMIDEEGNKLRVIYYGAKPRDFEFSEQVVVAGRWDASQGAFIARKVLLKCPSKYVEQPSAINDTSAL